MTAKVAIVAGFGAGISAGVAALLGKQGYALALLSRTQSKLDDAAAGFAKAGVNARGFAVDLSNPEAVKATVQTIRSSFGSIAVIFWNPYGGKAGATEATPADWTAAFNLTTISLSVAVNESLQDLEANKGAVLVTGGALGVVENDFIFQLAVNWHAATMAVPMAAQHKYVGVLHHEVKPRNIFVGEVTVLGAVKGTGFDDGTATLEVSKVVAAFEKLFAERSSPYTTVAP